MKWYVKIGLTLYMCLGVSLLSLANFIMIEDYDWGNNSVWIIWILALFMGCVTLINVAYYIVHKEFD